MARMMIKFEALRDAKEVFECSNGSKLVNLWVQDLDDSKLKLGLTAFDKDGTYLGIRSRDRFEAVAKVGSRKNDYYKLVDKNGRERDYYEPQYTIESLSPVGGRKPSDEEQFIADIAEAFPAEEEEDADLPF